MINGYKLILDTHCEVYDLLKQFKDGEFWDLGRHEIVPNAVYLIGRQQCKDHTEKFKEIAQRDDCVAVFSNPHEGSETIVTMLIGLNLDKLAVDQKVLIIGGGDMESKYTCLTYDSFITKVLMYQENTQAMSRSQEIFDKKQKPYNFLFLNGRARPHRKFLHRRLEESGVLTQALWSWLDRQGFMVRPGTITYLPEKYEVPQYRNRLSLPAPADCTFVKSHLFNNSWGEIYINPDAYIDTHFSVVTETVFAYPYSFRTEKIWKPIAMAHPWIALANCGFYRDMHNLGFRTFGHLIDESFDTIDNLTDRVNRVADVIIDLCQQDLADFTTAAEEVCKYNQQHLIEIEPGIRSDFTRRFLNFITPYLK